MPDDVYGSSGGGGGDGGGLYSTRSSLPSCEHDL